MLRLIICALWSFFAMVFSCPLHFHFKRLIKKDPMKGWTTAYKYVRGFFKKLIFLTGSKIEVRGQENIPKDGAVLFVGNHRSWFDIIIVQTLTNRPMGFISKKEFENAPLLSPYMKDIGCIYIDRENPREAIKTISKGIEQMKTGLSLGLYPEGTRNHGDELLPFKEGGYKMAERSKSPIVIVTMTGTDDIFENNKFHFIKKSRVLVDFSKPVYPSELSVQEKKEFYASIPEHITEKYAELKSERNK
ncbi:MAG: 1-acyl-sn-glycerol-3-phosphate acyltransferase [Eubacterium sp.]|nr:1-acyl-sn-glycerol-3-phosphate acyltransferase [Eubacterium sp.]MBR6218059.1 1-acyl-sn-glycerol-3-phosphate acyltransferase [Eubacterium sp.]